jgi:hypothetical protein
MPNLVTAKAHEGAHRDTLVTPLIVILMQRKMPQARRNSFTNAPSENNRQQIAQVRASLEHRWYLQRFHMEIEHEPASRAAGIHCRPRMNRKAEAASVASVKRSSPLGNTKSNAIQCMS